MSAGHQKPFGTLEIVTAPLLGVHPDPVLLHRLSELVRAGGIQIMDFAIATLNASGTVSWSEIDEDEFALAGVKLTLPGILAEQDFRYVLDEVGVGGWAIALVEHTWSYPEPQYQRSGATVVPIVSIPSEIVEAMVDIVSRKPLP